MRHFFFMLIALVYLLPMQANAGDLLGSLLQMVSDQQPPAAVSTNQQRNEPSFSEQFAQTVRGATDVLLESYKEEGREYAKEVGDIITQRIVEDKKINDTLSSMRIFCWAVVIYLTLVTILIIFLLLRLRVLYAKIMNTVAQSGKN